ncbi:MAG: hypothetical protein AAEJ57_03210, partial [Opitutales bacterium]
MKPLSLPTFLAFACISLQASEFSSQWHQVHDRVWLGEEYWANPMEDWAIQDGRVVCLRSGVNRNIHLLTYGLSEKIASFTVSIRLGIQKDSPKNGSAGFSIGVIDEETRDPRASLLFGKGLVAGVKANGKLFIGNNVADQALPSLEDVTLRLEVAPNKRKGFHSLRIIAFQAKTDKELGRFSWQLAKSETLTGNVAIGCNMDRGLSVKGAPKLA